MINIYILITINYFRVKYGENLPNNWLELVENCPHIVKDRVVNGLLVLLPNNEVSYFFIYSIIIIKYKLKLIVYF